MRACVYINNNKLKRRTPVFCKKRTSYHKSMYFLVSLAIIQLGFLAIKEPKIYIKTRKSAQLDEREK
jgi:hypothetical protein